MRNDPSAAAKEIRQNIEMDQMSRTIRQMQNEITRLKRGENLIPSNLNIRAPSYDQRMRNERIEEHRPRAPKVPNPIVVVLEEIVEEDKFENLDQETCIIQDQVLKLVQIDEGPSSFYIFDEQEDLECS